MNYRDKAFKEKFNNVAGYLDVTPNQIISLKFREIVRSYSEYHHLLDTLKHEIIMQCWNNMRGRFSFQGHRNLRDIEIRTLDNKGHVKEDSTHKTGILEPVFLPYSALISATQNIETEKKN